ncbi:MAG: hypothetical protein HY548_08405 [Elusimicrobia bacterium]|nr:hypothetical protein [Elusimicrobiota bacterium]
MSLIGDGLSLRNLVFVAGCLHFFQLPAVFIAPRMLNWREEFSRLSPINRRIFEMVGLGIMLMTIGAGVVVVIAPGEVAGGSVLGTSLAGYLGIVWGFRTWVQVFVYSKIWPAGRWGRLTHYGMLANLSMKTAIYMTVFLFGVVRI